MSRKEGRKVGRGRIGERRRKYWQKRRKAKKGKITAELNCPWGEERSEEGKRKEGRNGEREKKKRKAVGEKTGREKQI